MRKGQGNLSLSCYRYFEDYTVEASIVQRVRLNPGESQQRVLFLYALCRRPRNVPASQLLTTCFDACFEFRFLSTHSSSLFPCSWAVGPSALPCAEESSGNAFLKTIVRHPRVVFAAVPLSSSVLAANQRSLDRSPAGASTEGLGKDDAEVRLMTRKQDADHSRIRQRLSNFLERKQSIRDR